MKSLLEKVQGLEQEAKDRLSNLEAAGKKAVADMLMAEVQVIDDVRAKAERRGVVIIKERIRMAAGEINELKQDQERSIKLVHSQADQNRERAVQQVLDLFTDAYL